MLIDRNAFDMTTATSASDMRENCVGCKDCDGPCHMLLQLHHLPDVLLSLKETRP